MVVGADVCTPLDMLPHKKRRSEYGGCGSPSKRQCASPAQSAPSPLSPDGLQVGIGRGTDILPLVMFSLDMRLRWRGLQPWPMGKLPEYCVSPLRCSTFLFQAEPQTSTVVLLGDEGGIWHVDGLLELLTGALCAALCGDPAALSTLAPCAGPDGSSSSGCGSEAVTSTATHVTPTPDPEHGAAQVSAAAAKTVAPAGAAGRPSLASTPGPASTPAAARPGPAPAALLTEANLQRHITQQQQHERAEDDVVSEASLSEWIYGATASPR